MTDISYYHIQKQAVEVALAQLMERVIASGKRAVIRAPGEAMVSQIDDVLWSYDPDSFLPHGTAKTGFAEDQPIYITDGDDNPNRAEILVLVNEVSDDGLQDYERCLYLFDGRSEMITSLARKRWTSHKEAGHAMTYWMQSESGQWQKKQ